VSLGVRLGWAFPAGLLAKGDSLGSNLNAMLPIWLDGGYRVSRELYVGAFFQWAVAWVAGQWCPANLECSASDVRFGADVHLSLGGLIGLGESRKVDPWVGLGAGYESTSFKLSAGGTSSTRTYRGFELANAQLGADYTGFRAFRVGGFFTTTLALYSSLTDTTPTGSADYTPDRGYHLWFMLGVRGRYDL
jgi:hypothetical protein